MNPSIFVTSQLADFNLQINYEVRYLNWTLYLTSYCSSRLFRIKSITCTRLVPRRAQKAQLTVMQATSLHDTVRARPRSYPFATCLCIFTTHSITRNPSKRSYHTLGYFYYTSECATRMVKPLSNEECVVIPPISRRLWNRCAPRFGPLRPREDRRRYASCSWLAQTSRSEGG